LICEFKEDTKDMGSDNFTTSEKSLWDPAHARSEKTDTPHKNVGRHPHMTRHAPLKCLLKHNAFHSLKKKEAPKLNLKPQPFFATNIFNPSQSQAPLHVFKMKIINSKDLLKSIIGGAFIFSICSTMFLVNLQSYAVERELCKEQLAITPPVNDRHFQHHCTASSSSLDPVATGESSQHSIPRVLAARAPTGTALPTGVSQETIEIYGKDYPTDSGFTLEQTIRNDPLRFYRHVVKSLLWDNEPEGSKKVKLMDKMLAKYKGREDYLAQKLSARYNEEKQQKQKQGAINIPRAKKEKLAAQNGTALASTVPQETIETYGKDYPTDFGLTLEQTIRNDPLRFYRHVVQWLLWDAWNIIEPEGSEKVRSTADELLREYKGREDHLVQKLSAKYNKKKKETITVPSTKKEESVRSARVDACIIVRTYFEHAPVLVRFCLFKEECFSDSR
jgi:hypothetical protein